MRRALRFALAAVAPLACMAATLAFTASPAGASTPLVHAAPCGPSSPTPSNPNTGVQATLDPGPAPHGNSLYDRFGEGGGFPPLYDNGCGGEIIHPDGVLDDIGGNFFFAGAKLFVAGTQGLQRLISPPTFLNAFDRVTRDLTNGFRHVIYNAWLPLSLLLLGIIIACAAFRGALPHALRSAGWALLVMGLATFAFDYPVYASHAADNAMTTVLGAINTGLSPGQGSTVGATGTLEVDDVLYRYWLDGVLGSDSSQTAQQYGQRIYSDLTYNWGQPVTSDATSQKEDDFATAASEIKAADPSAYDSLKGRAGGRTAAGFMAFLASFITCVFRFVAEILVVASLLILRLVVILFPILAVVGIHQRTSQVIKGTLMATGAALINAVVFSAGAAVNLYAVSVLLSPSSGLSSWVGLLLSAILAYLLWHLLKPFRRLTHMVSGAFSPVHSATEKVSEHSGKVRELAAVAVGGIGGAALEAVNDARKRRGQGSSAPAAQDGAPEEAQQRPEAWQRPALTTGEQASGADDDPLAPSPSPGPGGAAVRVQEAPEPEGWQRPPEPAPDASEGSTAPLSPTPDVSPGQPEPWAPPTAPDVPEAPEPAPEQPREPREPAPDLPHEEPETLPEAEPPALEPEEAPEPEQPAAEEIA